MNEVDELLLEHFGTKGMRWGQRKTQDKGSGSNGGHKKLTPEQKKKAVLIGAVIVGGAAVTTVILARNRHVKIQNIAKKARNAEEFNKLWQQHLKDKVSLHENEAHKRFIREFTQKQNEINRGANEDLKSIYKLASTPIKDRGYLSEWAA